MTTLSKLRSLVAWYEWSDNPKAADALQQAADAYQAGALSDAAADALLAVWRPFVGVEAHVGKRPVTTTVADDDNLERDVIVDMRRLISKSTDSARRLHLTRLLERQIETFAAREAA